MSISVVDVVVEDTVVVLVSVDMVADVGAVRAVKYSVALYPVENVYDCPSLPKLYLKPWSSHRHTNLAAQARRRHPG